MLCCNFQCPNLWVPCDEDDLAGVQQLRRQHRRGKVGLDAPEKYVCISGRFGTLLIHRSLGSGAAASSFLGLSLGAAWMVLNVAASFLSISSIPSMPATSDITLYIWLMSRPRKNMGTSRKGNLSTQGCCQCRTVWHRLGKIHLSSNGTFPPSTS